MALNAKKAASTGGNKQDILAQENYKARGVQILDIGMQPQIA